MSHILVYRSPRKPGIITDPWAALDGRLGAPAGTPQFAGLLDSYPFRPPWKVAGVDYKVGIDRSVYPTNGDLRAPGSFTPAGCSWSGNTLQIDGTGGITSGVVVDGFDFTGGGGVNIYHTRSPRVSNSLFNKNSFLSGLNNQQAGVTSVGAHITKCEFDQLQTPLLWIAPLLILSNASDATDKHLLEYNLFKDSQSEHHQVHDGLSTGHIEEINYLLRFNAHYNAGVAAPVGAHGDWTHMWGDNITGAKNLFNLYYQDDPVSATRGVIDVSEQSRADALEIAYNTMLRGTTNVQQFANIIGAMIQILADVHHNYTDVVNGSGGPGFRWVQDPYNTGTDYPANAGLANVHDNILMTTGAANN